MEVCIQGVNPGFFETITQYVSEIEEPRYTLLRREGFAGSTLIFGCDEDDPYKAVPPIMAATRRPPLGYIMFCRVVPNGAIQWP